MSKIVQAVWESLHYGLFSDRTVWNAFSAERGQTTSEPVAYSLPSPVKDNPCCTKEDGVYWEMFSVATRDISVHPSIYFSSTTARIAWSTLSPILRGCPKRTRRAVSVLTPVRHSWYAWHHISHLGTLLKWCSSSHEFCKDLWRLHKALCHPTQEHH